MKIKKHPIPLRVWQAEVRHTQDLVRRHLPRTALELRPLLDGKPLESEPAKKLVLLASAEAQQIGLQPLVLFHLASHIVALLRDLIYLEPADYCDCHDGKALQHMHGSLPLDAVPDLENPPICIRCNAGIKRKTVQVEGVH